LLNGKGVRVVLTGGINLHFQNLFQSHGIDVIWGLIGTPEEALGGFLAGEITPGMGRCPTGGHRHRHRGGAP
jgi:predicted Fe-Mo cluster-binding NifX family protein